MKDLVRSGENYFLEAQSDKTDHLPLGVYVVKQSLMGFYLNKIEDFKLPQKLYGNFSIIDRWKKSYENNTERNMGIILSGLKGTGKTILAQKFCLEMQKPVILINEAYAGDSFIEFISSPKLRNSIIFIDEFEKIYTGRYNDDDYDDNEDSGNAKGSVRSLMKLMDGVYDTNLIFLFCVNEFKISEYFINRLNRIKYRKHFDNLEEDIVNDVMDDMLLPECEVHRESIVRFFYSLGICTFDLLVNIIKEVNFFKEDAFECAKHLNLENETTRYNVSVITKSGEVTYVTNETITGGVIKQISTSGNKELAEALGIKWVEENSYNGNARLGVAIDQTKLKYSLGDITYPLKNGNTIIFEKSKIKAFQGLELAYGW